MGAFIQEINGYPAGNECHFAKSLGQCFEAIIQEVIFENSRIEFKGGFIPGGVIGQSPMTLNWLFRYAAFVALEVNFSFSTNFYFTPF